MAGIRIGIVGCGRAARIHAARLRALGDVQVVALADSDRTKAESLASLVSADGSAPPASIFSDHQELLSSARPDVVAVFTPHRSHYRPVVDALQAGCHVFVEKPLSTNLQEAVDIANLARARKLVVAVGHQFRLCPSLQMARLIVNSGKIGKLRLVTATLAQPWLISHQGPDESWRLDPRVSGGGIVCDAGDHLLDALLWTTDRSPLEAYAVQERLEAGPDLVTAAALRLTGGLPATIAISGVCTETMFELLYLGESGRLRATATRLYMGHGEEVEEDVPVDPEPSVSIDADFIQAIRDGRPPCCPAEGALSTVRLLEAILRSASNGQPVRLGAPASRAVASP